MSALETTSTVRAALRKGWCPGALRPMVTGDGLLVRVRPRAGLYSLDALRTIARTAATFGSGEIDLTNRANLQLRGLCEAALPSAMSQLDLAGLLDESPAIEAVRNVIVDPLCGLDPERVDLRPLAAALEQRLRDDARLHALPGKFGFSFSGTPQPMIGQTAADISVTPHAPGTCALWLEGERGRNTIVRLNDAVDAVAALAIAFLDVRYGDPSLARMRDAVALVGSEDLFNRSGLRTGVATQLNTEASCETQVGVLGAAANPYAVAIGLPFGRINACELLALCNAAADAGCPAAGPSQHRTLVFPVGSASAAAALLEHALQSNFITRDTDARLKIDVCPGAPACSNATTSTRADAQRLVTAFEASGLDLPSVHISGCEKGCARRAAAALTFVAKDGHYDAVVNGAASGTAAMTGLLPNEMPAAARQLLGEHRQ